MSRLVEEYLRELVVILDEGDIESDSYNNALSIKMVIEKLYKAKNITNFDLNVIELISNGYGYSEIAEMLGVDRKKVTAVFKKLCERIAFILGEEFTNSGFMSKAEEQGK